MVFRTWRSASGNCTMRHRKDGMRILSTAILYQSIVKDFTLERNISLLVWTASVEEGVEQISHLSGRPTEYVASKWPWDAAQVPPIFLFGRNDNYVLRPTGWDWNADLTNNDVSRDLECSEGSRGLQSCRGDKHYAKCLEQMFGDISQT